MFNALRPSFLKAEAHRRWHILRSPSLLSRALQELDYIPLILLFYIGFIGFTTLLPLSPGPLAWLTLISVGLYFLVLFSILIFRGLAHLFFRTPYLTVEHPDTKQTLYLTLLFHRNRYMRDYTQLILLDAPPPRGRRALSWEEPYPSILRLELQRGDWKELTPCCAATYGYPGGSGAGPHHLDCSKCKRPTVSFEDWRERSDAWDARHKATLGEHLARKLHLDGSKPERTLFDEQVFHWAIEERVYALLERAGRDSDSKALPEGSSQR